MYYGWIVVAACFLVTMVTFGAGYSFGVFLNPLRETFATTSAAISGAYSLQIFLYTAMAMLAGWSMDRWGARLTTMAGGILIFSGLLLTGRTTTVWQLYGTYALIGAGMSTSYAPLMATVSKWFDRRRGLVIGIASAGLGVGPLIMAPVASYIISIADWRFAYLLMSLTAALIIPAALFMKQKPNDTVTSPPALKATAPAKSTNTSESDYSVKEAARTRPFWFMCIMFFLVGLGLQMILAHIVAYSQLKGIPAITAAAVLSTVTGASIAGRIVWGLVSDRIGRKKTLAICVFSEGAIIIWLMGASSAWMLFLFAVVFGFGYGGHATQFPALIGDVFGLKHMGANLGAVVFFWGMGGALGSALAGYIFDVTGVYTSAFILGAAGMLTAGAVTFLVKRPVKM